MENKNEIIISQPDSLISLAIEKGANIEQLEKLLQLRQEWERGEARKSFKMAMSQFQAEKPKLIKSEKVNFTNKTGGVTRYNFATLSSIQEKIDPILSKFALSYRWEQAMEADKIRITCIVSHADGHEETTYITAPLDVSGNKNSIQSIGSTVSYLKRYTLEGACGLSSDNDDDGGKPKEKELPELSPKNKEKWEAAKFAVNSGNATISAIKNKYKISAENEKLLTDGKQ